MKNENELFPCIKACVEYIDMHIKNYKILL